MSKHSNKQATKRKKQTKKKKKRIVQVTATQTAKETTGDLDQQNQISLPELEVIIKRAQKQLLSEQEIQMLLSVSQTILKMIPTRTPISQTMVRKRKRRKQKVMAVTVQMPIQALT